MVDKRHALSIRLAEDRYEWLRRQAFDRRIPMQQIIDEALDRYRADDGPARAASPQQSR